MTLGDHRSRDRTVAEGEEVVDKRNIAVPDRRNSIATDVPDRGPTVGE
jgi:hypothetical protein